ncbi:hypothetical protein HDV04_004512 [Boothiomyces sp. JEL0838]|nr:hypothetical protein HDV04_004512 [Boothiomyces sp. JEL0838]
MPMHNTIAIINLLVGEYQNYTLTSDLQIVSYLNTSIAVSNTIFSGGKVENMWTGYIPSAILVPTFHAPLEIVGMGCYIAAIALAVGVAYIEGKHFWLGARYIFLAQFIWIIWVIMNLSDWVVLYPNVLSYEIMQAVENCLYNIGSMTSVLATFGLLLNYFKVVDANRRMNGYLILWLIHIIFAGNCYLTALSYVSGYYAFLYTYWNDIYPLWNLFQFTLNTIPPLYIYLTIIKLYSTEKNVKFKKAVAKIIKNAPLIVTLLPLQILNSLVYMVLSVIIQYTQILGNDRNFLAWNGLLCLANVNHEVFNLLLMTNLTNLVDKVNLKNKAKVPTESSTKSSALASLQNTQKKVEI